ncbi:LysM domain [Sesbania bispinosa]|nr:LysM domain [Sesbania bispinosa]
MAFNSRNGSISLSSKAIADHSTSWYCAFILVALVVLSIYRDESLFPNHGNFIDSQLLSRPCDEIYVVGEGETLHTISDKCGDPFIVENNPHIHDPDDVFPGLVIKITPSHHI